ncbi:Hypothetical predicted protein [Paramuricea clavata]|uniref:Uncharacterized protein n=1 Tax=Paramuricea clavata TaxID=317549 RepID=A0A6S7I7M8_PARCT|nr:Hypothetical predicted protein [Paramuricea clavata]
MSSIVTSILSSTVGLLWNKARDSTAAILQGGEVPDENIREIVVSELNDIKTKLHGLLRNKDLLSSYKFLQEGVDLFNVSLNKLKLEQSGILNEALELSRAMGKLKINSDKEFESTKERFKDARKTATHAFSNETLSIKDRIFAAKLRIVSEVLEYLESPETAITGCLSFLKKLHSLPTIEDTFSVYLNGGLKSLLNKSERVENVRSVMLINGVLFQYVSKFSSKFSTMLAWPTIELADRSFNPILDWQEISTRKSIGDELTQLPNGLILNEEMDPRNSAVNSHGDVIVGEQPDNIKIINKTGESKVVELHEASQVKVIAENIAGLAVDKNDNVYVVRWVRTSTGKGSVLSYVLTVLDENYNVKQDSRRLEFLEVSNYYVKIAINKNNNIIMIKGGDPQVYVCDNTGKLKHKFELRGSRYALSLSICGQGEIMISSGDDQAVHIYSGEGNSKSTIKLPEGHAVRELAFHYVICKIIVLTYVEKKNSNFLLCYTKAGELETTTFFSKRISGEYCPRIKSHPSGPVAIVRGKSTIFI